MKIKFKPVGLTCPIELTVLEDRRPGCCPDPKGCKPIYTSLSLNENLAKGYSGQCYGYCGERRFTYEEAEHVNDISRCVMTPLKGVVRFFQCYTDFMGEIGELKRIAYMLKPSECEECGETQVFETMHGYSSVANCPKWLCLGCAVRLGIVSYVPENKGTARAKYLPKS